MKLLFLLCSVSVFSLALVVIPDLGGAPKGGMLATLGESYHSQEVVVVSKKVAGKNEWLSWIRKNGKIEELLVEDRDARSCHHHTQHFLRVCVVMFHVVIAHTV